VLQTLSWLPRTEGAARLSFARRDEQTRLDVLYQAGAARVRFPRPATGAPPEAVLLNTAGGLTGGDHMSLDVTLGARAEATLAWLPQATILFDGSRLDRRTDVQLAGDACFLGVEFLIFGRQAMGEDVHLGACQDAWRIRRDGALVFADTFRVGGAIAAALDRPATLTGARAAVMLIYVAADAASRLEAVRAMLEGVESVAGASAWNGLLVVRASARDGRTLQGDIAPVAQALSGRPLPRVWQC
jgi:urease accessory protein